MIKRLLSIFLLVAGIQAGWGFALLGPTGNGEDSWQTQEIGYGETLFTYYGVNGQPISLNDIGSPKNIGEGYRRNTPEIYYAYDSTFLGFFGADGATNIDNAFTIMNQVMGVTNISSYSPGLTEFPDNSQQFNFSAQNAYLTDLKSTTLHLLVETMGLAQPERFTWTLAERVLPTGAKCPFYNYAVLQRNFGIVPSAPTDLQYSAYVNDVQYSYFIFDVCSIKPPPPNPPAAVTIPFAVDPEAEEYTSVASDTFFDIGGPYGSVGGGLQLGGYYTGLTRDDVAGLRYLYESNNIVTEDAAAGAQLLSTNLPPLQLITTISWQLFLSQLTNDPNTLLSIYPNLIITSVTTNFSETNVTVLTPAFTNFPGTTFTNFAPPILITNIDIALFYQQLLTNPPAVLQALYPQLQILSSSILYYTNIPIPNIVTYLTNGGFGSPAGTVIQVTATNGFSPNIFPIYTYTFGNIYTNAFALNNTVTNQIITLTNLIGAPAGSQVLKVTNKPLKLTNSPSGDFFIIPTNWCGFNIFQKIYQQKVPSFTNTLSVAFTNNLGSAAFTQNLIYYYTNRIWAVEPGVCEPTLIFETNVVDLVVTNYQYTFGNLFTNPPTMQFTNSQVITIITNVGPCPGNMAGQVCTNITTTTNNVNTPSGDFFIIPAAWTCGFDIVSVVSTNLVGTTNTVLTLPPVGVTNEGEFFSVTTISIFTNHTLLIQPFICQLTPSTPALREGVESVQFIRANFDSFIGQLFQPITNYYTMVKVTNSTPTREFYERVITQPDILLSAQDFIAASAADGIGLLTVSRDITFDQATVPNGQAGPGTIAGPVTFSYNKIGDVQVGVGTGTGLETFLTQNNSYSALAWGSFDGSTNPPEVYPNGNSIQNLQNQILIQISPTSLVNGTSGVAYPAVTFTTTGGSFSQPFTWSGANLPPGMGVSAGGTLSGTPTQSGTYDITVQLVDKLGRSVQWFYTLIIQ